MSVSAFAEGRLPANIQTAFLKLYPQATDVEWEQMAGCYVAEFIADGQEIDVWFNKQAEWVMTETDVESLEKRLHRSMYSYVRLSIDDVQLRTSEHRSMYSYDV